MVDLVADAGTTTPNGCTCTTICSCVECDPGRPNPFGETRDSCSTGELEICDAVSLTDHCLRIIIRMYFFNFTPMIK